MLESHKNVKCVATGLYVSSEPVHNELIVYFNVSIILIKYDFDFSIY